MSAQSSDVFTRQAAEAISRRRSLLALTTAGAAAALSGPAVSTAKKGGRNKKRKRKKKDPFKTCKRQVEICKDAIEDRCVEVGCSPEALAESLECCEFLETCDATEFLDCLVTFG